MKKKSLSFIGALALSISLLLSGCGRSSDSASYSAKSAGGDANYATESANYEAAMSEDYDQVSDADNVEVDDSTRTTDRKLITTVNINSETVSFDETISWVEAKTVELGGYVESSSISVSGNYYYSEKYVDLHTADYVIRIPEQNLEGFLTDVDSRTNITYKSKNVEDVTLTYTDIMARQEALESEKVALENLMEKAETMEDILTIQSELTDVQYQIDSIKSQLRVYDNKIDYGTINISIKEVEPDDLTVTEKKTVLQRIAVGFMSSLKGTGNFLVELFIVIAVNLPQLILIAGVVVVIVLLAKRKKKNPKNNNIRNQKVGFGRKIQGDFSGNVKGNGKGEFSGNVNDNSKEDLSGNVNDNSKENLSGNVNDNNKEDLSGNVKDNSKEDHIE